MQLLQFFRGCYILRTLGFKFRDISKKTIKQSETTVLLYIHFWLANLQELPSISLIWFFLLLLAGYILDLHCVRPSNTALFCENYAKLYFNAKHLEKVLGIGGWGGKTFGALFSKKYPFQPISNVALNF